MPWFCLHMLITFPINWNCYGRQQENASASASASASAATTYFVCLCVCVCVIHLYSFLLRHLLDNRFMLKWSKQSVLPQRLETWRVAALSCGSGWECGSHCHRRQQKDDNLDSKTNGKTENCRTLYIYYIYVYHKSSREISKKGGGTKQQMENKAIELNAKEQSLAR